MKNCNTAFGTLVKEKRLGLGLTQVQLSEMAGVSLRTVNLIETEGHIPRPKTVNKLNKCLNIQDTDLAACNAESKILLVSIGNGDVAKLSEYLLDGRDIRYLLQGMFNVQATGAIALKDILWMLEIEKQIGAPISEDAVATIFAERKS